MSSFVSKVKTLRFFLSDSPDISLFLLGVANFYKILIITKGEIQQWEDTASTRLPWMVA
jgi:hypothetical protein